MATDNNLLGLRAQITGKSTALLTITETNAYPANLKVLDTVPIGEIVTVQNSKDKWQVAYVRNSEVHYTDGTWCDTKKAALESFLEFTSYELYAYLSFYQE